MRGGGVERCVFALPGRWGRARGIGAASATQLVGPNASAAIQPSSRAATRSRARDISSSANSRGTQIVIRMGIGLLQERFGVRSGR
ncbi:hypothetical protein GCM10011320_56090 [Neoroseomonas lacus]|uniref:Uncharacterized protein n=1 Tax=Neoroseomonas lacus TaxID=287609 RepID=A0A917L286_9PROT|nr:hypothetical protein GCM10011320_56090 [Neoroseomonas lacus]